MRKAVEDAIANAEAYAAGAKVRISGVVDIKVLDGDSDRFGVQAQGSGNRGGERCLAAGAWQVSSMVRVVCRY